MRNSTYRPASYHELSAKLDGRGWPVAFSHRIVMPSINGQKGTPTDGGIDPEVKDEASFVYGFPYASIECVMTQIAIPLGWMRSVNALQVAYAADSVMGDGAA